MYTLYPIQGVLNLRQNFSAKLAVAWRQKRSKAYVLQFQKLFLIYLSWYL